MVHMLGRWTFAKTMWNPTEPRKCLRECVAEYPPDPEPLLPLIPCLKAFLIQYSAEEAEYQGNMCTTLNVPKDYK